MNCGRCGGPLYGPVCGACGTPAPTPCTLCGNWVYGAYCPACGAPQAPMPPSAPPVPSFPAYPAYPATAYPPPYAMYPMAPPREPYEGLREGGSVAWLVALALFTLLTLISLAAFLWIAGTMIAPGIPAAGPQACDGDPCVAYLLFVSPVPPFLVAPWALSGDAFFAYFVILAVFIVGAYAVHVLDLRRLAEAVRRPLKDFGGRFESKSSWSTTGQLWMATFFLQLLLGLALGAPTDPLSEGNYPDWYLYFSLEQASVHEEWVSRVLYVGVPLLIFSVAAVWRSGTVRERMRALGRIAGGGLDRRSSPALLTVGAVTLLVSSIVFGLAHVPGWGWWKFLPTFFAGLAMGYLFLRHGLAAAILFHFTNDYFIGATLFLEGNDAASTALVLAIFAVLVLGAVFLVVYVVYGLELLAAILPRMLGRGATVPGLAPVAPPAASVVMAVAPPAFAPSPAAPSPPSATFRCASCGSIDAALTEGRLRCLVCGTLA